MSKKLRVFMLSLVVVMFAVSSVFAALQDDIGLNQDDEYAPDAVATAGYNYSAKYVLSLTEWDDEETPDTRTLGNVSWEVYPRNPADTWFSYRVVTSGNSSTIYLDGAYPPYVDGDDAANNHYFMVAAHVSADVENDDYDEDVPGSQEYITQDVVFYAGEETPDDQSDEDERQWLLVASEGADETTVGLFPDMVSIDVSAGSDIAVARKDNYEVIINFTTTPSVTIAEDTDDDDKPITTRTSGDIFVNAQLGYTAPDPDDEESEAEFDPAAPNLPSWLGYEVLETQYTISYNEDDDGNLVPEADDSTAYVKRLRIFYKADVEPEQEMFGTVRIQVTAADTPAVTDERDNGDANESTQPLSEKYESGATIGWNVTFSPITPISLDKTEESITVKYGSSADITLNYSDHNPAESDAFSFAPDLSDDVALTVTSASTGTDEAPAGTITIHVEPKKQLIKLYSTDLTVTDTNGLATTVRLNISVDVDPIAVTPESASVGVLVGAASDVSFTVANNSGNVVWAFGTLPEGIAIANDNSGKYTVRASEGVGHDAPAAAGSYSFDITATDEAGRTASAVVYLTVLAGDITVAESGDAIPESLVINTGTSNSYTLTAGNTYNAVKWLVSGAPEGMITPVSGDGSAFTFTINPAAGTAGDYRATITAEDETGRKQEKTFSWTVRNALELTVDSETVSVDYGSAKDISVYYDNQTPVKVSFTSYDVFSADLEISYDISTSSVDSHDGVIVVTVIPIKPVAAVYNTEIVVTDSDDYTATKTLNISVDIGAVAVLPESVDVSMDVGGSADVTFIATIFSEKVTWTLGTIPAGITVTEGNGTAIATEYGNVAAYTITGETAGSYSFDVTATDSRDETATATVYVEVTGGSTPPAPRQFTITAPVSSLSVVRGSTATISFTAANNSGDIKSWSAEVVSGTASGITVTHTSGGSFTVAGNTAGSYSVRVTATDAADRTASATISITVTEQPAAELTLLSSAQNVSFVAGSSGTVTFTVQNASGAVTWTVGTVSSGVTVTSNGNGSFTVTGTVEGTYSAAITATDAAGRTVNGTITIEVTGKGNAAPQAWTEETMAIVENLVDNGSLAENGTLPSKAVDYTPENPLLTTLSPTETTAITKGEDVNPVELELEFPVDIWRIYIGNLLAAWAYSPGYTGAEFVATEETSYSSNGVSIVPESKTKATVYFETETMPTGTNDIEVRVVAEDSDPTQEIGNTTLATVEVADDSTPTSGDVRGVGSSSGGCDAGLGALVSALAAAFFISRKRS